MLLCDGKQCALKIMGMIKQFCAMKLEVRGNKNTVENAL